MQMQRRILSQIGKITDEKILKKINKLVKKAEDKEIVGRTVDGKPINRKQLDKLIQKSREDVKNGNTLTLEEAIAESETWLQ